MSAATSELTELLGFDLERTRQRFGLSVRAICQIAGVSYRQVWHWLNGTHLPSGRSVLRLRRHFDQHGIKTGEQG